jgi:4'-phosphopantetheinyl transferase
MNREISWQHSSGKIKLQNNDVHIWHTNLNLEIERVEEALPILSLDEQKRAERYKFEKHRNYFIVARSTLRKILSSYLNIEPERLEFNYSDRGKPILASDRQNENLQFNLSHSQELALYSFTKNQKIGIDLEYCRPMPDAESIAQRFFSTNEYKWISSLSGNAQQEAFFRCWTAKEAYLKATGEGIGGSLERIEIDLTRSGLFKLKEGDREISNWLLYNFIPDRNYMATVAVESQAIDDISYFYAEF